MRLMLSELLRRDDFEVHEAPDAARGLRLIAEIDPDVILLDDRLPDAYGTEVLVEIRRHRSVPVLLVTANSEEADRVRGLDLGADDYVVKPFLPDELRARVRTAIRRRVQQMPREPLRFDGLEIDLDRMRVMVRGAEVELRQKEFEVLAALACGGGVPLSRDQLLRDLWGTKEEWQDPATVTEHIRRIRLKIEDHPNAPRWILTVRGVGYRFGG